MANVVGGKDLLDSIEVARVVVELLDLTTHYGLVLFGGHWCILLSDLLPLAGHLSTVSMMPPAAVRRELPRTPSWRSSENAYSLPVIGIPAVLKPQGCRPPPAGAPPCSLCVCTTLPIIPGGSP